MSSIKATKIDGDVSVGRHAALGGDLTTQGGCHVKGSLRVDGKLKAHHVMSCEKGLFSTEEYLYTVYPHPKDGWWAVVGRSLPGLLYLSENGRWVNTGNPWGADIGLDIEQYEEEIETLRVELSDSVADILELQDYIRTRQIETMSEEAYEALEEKDDDVFYFVYENEHAV